MGGKTVLISGLGAAGPTLAFWLSSAGFRPTLIEHAPALRSGGYVIDFWGLGYEIAERMGLINAAALPGFARIAFGSSSSDNLRLPEYSWNEFSA